ncbi:MAG: hypothetical protein HY906_13485 [Deltaproteobacteria bacterium]|nr:hypothetical protein [Deltaproteobacteria bacterium]
MPNTADAVGRLGCRRDAPFLLGLAALALSGGLACDSKDAQRAGPSAPRPPVVSEHRPLAVAKATKDLGADCSAGGASECLSGLCLHTSNHLSSGFVCSRLCGQGQRPCPGGFACMQGHPSPRGMWCLATSTAAAKGGQP